MPVFVCCGPQQWPGSLLSLVLRSGESHLPTLSPVLSVELYMGPHRLLRLPKLPDSAQTHSNFWKEKSNKQQTHTQRSMKKLLQWFSMHTIQYWCEISVLILTLIARSWKGQIYVAYLILSTLCYSIFTAMCVNYIMPQQCTNRPAHQASRSANIA